MNIAAERPGPGRQVGLNSINVQELVNGLTAYCNPHALFAGLSGSPPLQAQSEGQKKHGAAEILVTVDKLFTVVGSSSSRSLTNPTAVA